MSKTEKQLRKKLKELLEHEEFMLEVLSYEDPESEEAFYALASVILNSGLILKAKKALKSAKDNRDAGKE